jgi:hypothetical protein
MSGHGAKGAELSRKVRTGLILASIALAFYVGVILRHWYW